MSLRLFIESFGGILESSVANYPGAIQMLWGVCEGALTWSVKLLF